MAAHSHSHFDHTGNPDTFSKNAALVVGPGTQAVIRPGWPKNPEAAHPESDFEDREVIELASFDHGLVGGMNAHDYFGDGSFYLLDAPGVRLALARRRTDG
jgi:L-ascorbate metabolism protein UlaG (beta-lactamase superfamily)